MPQHRWGDTITYRQSTGWYHQGKQLPEDGPGGTVVQVRADGWMGNAPIMAVDPSDIINGGGKP